MISEDVPSNAMNIVGSKHHRCINMTHPMLNDTLTADFVDRNGLSSILLSCIATIELYDT